MLCIGVNKTEIHFDTSQLCCGVVHFLPRFAHVFGPCFLLCYCVIISLDIWQKISQYILYKL